LISKISPIPSFLIEIQNPPVFIDPKETADQEALSSNAVKIGVLENEGIPEIQDSIYILNP
jgi:hypothetical protein